MEACPMDRYPVNYSRWSRTRRAQTRFHRIQTVGSTGLQGVWSHGGEAKGNDGARHHEEGRKSKEGSVAGRPAECRRSEGQRTARRREEGGRSEEGRTERDREEGRFREANLARGTLPLDSRGGLLQGREAGLQLRPVEVLADRGGRGRRQARQFPVARRSHGRPGGRMREISTGAFRRSGRVTLDLTRGRSTRIPPAAGLRLPGGAPRDRGFGSSAGRTSRSGGSRPVAERSWTEFRWSGSDGWRDPSSEPRG